MADPAKPDLTLLTVELLGAYFESNKLDAQDLAGLIRTTHDALKALNSLVTDAEPGPTPAVGLRKSLSSPDHILSMIDGKPYKTLKRHLTSHGLSPEEYRARYGLPADYPMVAKSFSDRRREIAAQTGLGRRPKAETVAAPAPDAVPAVRPKRAPLKLRLSGNTAKAD